MLPRLPFLPRLFLFSATVWLAAAGGAGCRGVMAASAVF